MYEIEKGIRDTSVAAALRKVLADNSRISENEVKAILKSTLDGRGANKVTDNEYHDLMMILRKSKSITDQSRNVMTEFITKRYILKGPYVYSKVDDLEGNPKVFSGECAGIVQWYTTVGLARNWRQGITVKGNGGKIKKGTAIATFIDGFYPNQPHGNHAALYMPSLHYGYFIY